MPKLRYALMLLVPLTVLACEGVETDVGETAEDVPATAETSPAMDQAAIEEAVASVREDWGRGADAGNSAQVASLYADDAVMVGPGGQSVEGRQAIEDVLTTAFEGVSSTEITNRATEIGVDLASDMGTFTQTLQTEDGEQTVSGDYLVVLRRQDDGSWKILHHFSAPSAEPEGDTGQGEDM